jgi:hypothetical protein
MQDINSLREPDACQRFVSGCQLDRTVHNLQCCTLQTYNALPVTWLAGVKLIFLPPYSHGSNALGPLKRLNCTMHCNVWLPNAHADCTVISDILYVHWSTLK